jgi:hypothetical protein
MRNPPRPVKRPRLESFTSDSLFGKDSGLSEGSEHTELTLPLLDTDHCNETIVTDTFYGNNQCKWQVHYFDALDTKPSSDNDEFHDALEQFADDPDSVINLVIYHANCAHYVCDHETVEAAPKFVMTLEPDYGQLCPRLSWLSIDAYYSTRMHAHEYYTQEMIQVSKSCLERASS